MHYTLQSHRTKPLHRLKSARKARGEKLFWHPCINFTSQQKPYHQIRQSPGCLLTVWADTACSLKLRQYISFLWQNHDQSLSPYGVYTLTGLAPYRVRPLLGLLLVIIVKLLVQIITGLTQLITHLHYLLSGCCCILRTCINLTL